MSLRFKNISYRYGTTEVLNKLDFEAKSGEITCLLGPSGGGKSTLLRLAAGIEQVQSGAIEVNGTLVASEHLHIPPEKRPIGLMFQESALFPHMSVFDNIRFGLSQLSKAEQDTRVAELLEMVSLAEYGDRFPHELSGGQQQRIALIRSLAPKPQVLLMDEPYASIDITLRRSLREAARVTLKQDGTTSVMVTHDPPEAMEMADTIAVLDQGEIVQVGTPQTLYEKPNTASVAALFGDAQRIKASRQGQSFITEYGVIDVDTDFHNILDDKACELVARPNGLLVNKSQDKHLQVIDLRYVGDMWIAFLLPRDTQASAAPLRAIAQDGIALGDWVSLKARQTGFFAF